MVSKSGLSKSGLLIKSSRLEISKLQNYFREGYVNFPLHALKSTIGAGGLLGGVQI